MYSGRCARIRRQQLHLLTEQASCLWPGTWQASSDRCAEGLLGRIYALHVAVPYCVLEHLRVLSWSIYEFCGELTSSGPK